MLMLPMMKFAVGTISYLISVVVISFRDLKGAPKWKWCAFAVGVSTVTMVFATMAIIFRHRLLHGRLC